MRLIKAAAYAALGYLLYELFLGIAEGADKDRSQGQANGSAAPKARPSRGTQMRGRDGQGRWVETHDATGGTTRHTVGRGVVGS